MMLAALFMAAWTSLSMAAVLDLALPCMDSWLLPLLLSPPESPMPNTALRDDSILPVDKGLMTGPLLACQHLGLVAEFCEGKGSPGEPGEPSFEALLLKRPLNMLEMLVMGLLLRCCGVSSALLPWGEGGGWAASWLAEVWMDGKISAMGVRGLTLFTFSLPNRSLELPFVPLGPEGPGLRSSTWAMLERLEKLLLVASMPAVACASCEDTGATVLRPC